MMIRFQKETHNFFLQGFYFLNDLKGYEHLAKLKGAKSNLVYYSASRIELDRHKPIIFNYGGNQYCIDGMCKFARHDIRFMRFFVAIFTLIKT
jgi:hypothetical protein